MNNPPVVFPGKRIQISLTKKTLIIGLQQLIDGIRITPILPVVDTDSLRILHAAVHSLDLFVTAQIGRHSGDGNRKGKENQREHKEHGKQQKPLFLLALQAAWNANARGRQLLRIVLIPDHINLLLQR